MIALNLNFPRQKVFLESEKPDLIKSIKIQLNFSKNWNLGLKWKQAILSLFLFLLCVVIRTVDWF